MGLVGKKKRGLAFILSAPAGTGKTTLVEMLSCEFAFVLKNVSFTTRAPRPNEVDGVDYHFVSKEEFEKKVADQEFLEHINLFGNYYGTSKRWIEDKLQQGFDVFLVIDTQGAMSLKNKFEATFIFVMPPSLEELRRRLEKRRTESPEVIEKRLALASEEMKKAQCYDYTIVNDDLETAYQILRSIVIAEENKV